MASSSADPIDTLQQVWECAALAQFYRVIGPNLLNQHQVTLLGTAEELEQRLIEGSEETLMSMMIPLLGIGLDADTNACWRTVAELMSNGSCAYTPDGKPGGWPL